MREKSNASMLFASEISELYRTIVPLDYAGILTGIGSKSFGVAFSLVDDPRPLDTCEIVACRLSAEPSYSKVLKMVWDRNARNEIELKSGNKSRDDLEDEDV